MAMGLAIALTLAEVIVRIRGRQVIQPRFVVDSGFGIRFNDADIDTRHTVPGDYKVRLTSNSVGMRGQAEYSLERPLLTYRIALLGDSMVFGYGVEDPQVVSALLEDELGRAAASRGTKVEVLNFGVPGFGQAEELVLYRNLVRPYQPQLAVLFYFSNDPGNNTVSNLFTLEGDHLVATGKPFLPGVKAREILYSLPPTRLLFTNSHAWNMVRNRLSSKVQKRLLRDRGLQSFSDTGAGAERLTRALMSTWVREARAEGSVPVVFVIPAKDITSNFPLQPDEVTALGALLIDGREHFVPDDYYGWDSHWRPRGHVKAARLLLEVARDLPTELPELPGPIIESDGASAPGP